MKKSAPPPPAGPSAEAKTFRKRFRRFVGKAKSRLRGVASLIFPLLLLAPSAANAGNRFPFPPEALPWRHLRVRDAGPSDRIPFLAFSPWTGATAGLPNPGGTTLRMAGVPAGAGPSILKAGGTRDRSVPLGGAHSGANRLCLALLLGGSVLAAAPRNRRRRRRRAETTLRKRNAELERRLAKRTAELAETEERLCRPSENLPASAVQSPHAPDGSVLRPKGDPDHLELADVLDIEAVQKLMDEFYALARVPMSVIDRKGRLLVGVGWQDICTRFHRQHPETLQNCLESDLRLSGGLQRGECRLYKCRNHLWDMATPIFMSDRHVGNIFTGQFFLEDERVDRDFFREQARTYGFDETKYLAALDRVPRLKRETVDRGMAFFIQLANILSRLGYANISLARLLEERDRLNESLRKSRSTLEAALASMTDAVLISDTAGRFVLFNNAFATFHRFSSKEECLESLADYPDILEVFTADGQRAPLRMWAVPRALRGEQVANAEYFLRRKDIGETWIGNYSFGPIRNADGEIAGSVVVARDVTDRKRAEDVLRESEERLRASLGEKEVMLKEIHHRVKNNMQVISSLVSLQSTEIRDESAREALEDVTHRVRSMALVHEKLYQSADLARVDLAEYAESLLHYLWRAHGARSSGIRLALDLASAPVSVEAAVPFGLILNELVGNALKHAFADRAEGRVEVALRGGPDGRIALRVRDDGPGLPAELDWQTPSTLGLRLVGMLARQLRGDLAVAAGGGAEFALQFRDIRTEMGTARGESSE